MASNGLKWCQKNLNASDVYFADQTHSPEGDFAVLSDCDHAIFSIGTFGWWIGWMAHMKGGTVVYFSGAFLPHTPLGNKYRKENYMLPEWIPMQIKFVQNYQY